MEIAVRGREREIDWGKQTTPFNCGDLERVATASGGDGQRIAVSSMTGF